MGEANRRAKAQGYKSAAQRKEWLTFKEVVASEREARARHESKRIVREESNRAVISVSLSSSAEVHARRVDWAASTTAMLHKRAVSPLRWIK